NPTMTRAQIDLRGKARPRWQRLLLDLIKDRSGATAVEFALIGTPFFLLLFAITEITISYFGNVQLENAMETVSRQIRTGEVQTANLTQAQFRNLLCAQAAPLIACDANLLVDVRTFSSFSNVQNVSPFNPDGSPNPAFQLTYTPGNAGDIVLARAFYVWH